MSKQVGDLLLVTFEVCYPNAENSKRLFNVGQGYTEGQSTLLAITTIPVEGHNCILVSDVKIAKSSMDPLEWERIDSDKVEVICTEGHVINVTFVLKAGGIP